MKKVILWILTLGLLAFLAEIIEFLASLLNIVPVETKRAIALGQHPIAIPVWLVFILVAVLIYKRTPAEVWKCDNCGAVVKGDAKTCPSCGAYFEEGEDLPPTTNNEDK